MAHNYFFNKQTGVHSLLIGIHWRANQSASTICFDLTEACGKFFIHGDKTADAWIFSIQLKDDEGAKYSVFKSCSVQLRDSKWLSSSAIDIQPSTTDRQFGANSGWEMT